MTVCVLSPLCSRVFISVVDLCATSTPLAASQWCQTWGGIKKRKQKHEVTWGSRILWFLLIQFVILSYTVVLNPIHIYCTYCRYTHRKHRVTDECRVQPHIAAKSVVLNSVSNYYTVTADERHAKGQTNTYMLN